MIDACKITFVCCCCFCPVVPSHYLFLSSIVFSIFSSFVFFHLFVYCFFHLLFICVLTMCCSNLPCVILFHFEFILCFSSFHHCFQCCNPFHLKCCNFSPLNIAILLISLPLAFCSLAIDFQHFKPNDHIEDAQLWKKIEVDKSGDISISQSGIKWKAGKNLVELALTLVKQEEEKQNEGDDAAVKRSFEEDQRSFFSVRSSFTVRSLNMVNPYTTISSLKKKNRRPIGIYSMCSRKKCLLILWRSILVCLQRTTVMMTEQYT